MDGARCEDVAPCRSEIPAKLTVLPLVERFAAASLEIELHPELGPLSGAHRERFGDAAVPHERAKASFIG